MRFIDEAEVLVSAGDGGQGCVSFCREKYRPHGGPDGGDGGNGGDVVFVADASLTTLLDFKYQPHVRAKRGEHGRGKQQYGKGGEDEIVRVPCGTLVYDIDNGIRLFDLNRPGMQVVLAHGGKGGQGNMKFTTSTNQAPRHAQPGLPGEHRHIRLELHLMADVGIVGFPNAGKSSLISRVSAAKPKVADYPFTTLVPHLGVVRVGDTGSFVLADIPGLIEGAHEGHGLGLRFLRHVSRTSVLIHLIDVSGLSGRDPVADYDTINHELACFDAHLATKPQIVVGNKLDLTGARECFEDAQARLAKRGIEMRGISAASGEGVDELIGEVARLLKDVRRAEAAEAAVSATESYDARS